MDKLTNQQAWVYINRVTEGVSAPLNEILGTAPIEDIARAIFRREKWIGQDLLDETESRYDWVRIDEDIAAAGDARLVTVESDEWPTELFAQIYADTDDVAPSSLWVRGEGNLANLLAQRPVAITGTRAMNRYGFDAARKVAYTYIDRGRTIANGGALGVETIVLEQAVGEVPILLFMPCGIDGVYPARNTPLFNRIAEVKGRAASLIVTPYPPGTNPQRSIFLERSKMMAAWVDRAVIVQSGLRSSAMLVAREVHRHGGKVVAIPGPFGDGSCTGGHLLVNEGVATLAVLEEDL